MCGRLWEDLSDLQALVDGISSGNPDWAAHLFDNVNIAAVINYMTSSVIMHENDHTHKNFFLYRDTEGTGEWMFLPWDKDLTFGINNGIGGIIADQDWPADSDLVIGTIEYNPSSANQDEEYVELVNIGTEALSLGGVHFLDGIVFAFAPDAVLTATGEGTRHVPFGLSEGGELVHLQSAVNGIEYEFPAGVSIPAHGYLIIAQDPAGFNALYGAGLPAGVQVLGPFAKDTKLNNSGERVTLSRAGDKEWLSERYYIRIASTEYSDSDPWPAAADGGGASLQHRHPDSGDARELYTNDSANWAAAEPGPGR